MYDVGSPLDIVVLSDRSQIYAKLEKQFAKVGYHNLSLYKLGPIGLDVVFRSHPELVIVDGTLSSLEALELSRQIKYHQCPVSSSILFLMSPTEEISDDLLKRYCVDRAVKQAGVDLSVIITTALQLVKVTTAQTTHEQPLLFSFV